MRTSPRVGRGRAYGPHVKGRKTAQRGSDLPEVTRQSHLWLRASPEGVEGQKQQCRRPPLSPWAPRPSCHSRARMKWMFWPEREISRPGRAEAGDKRIRLGWKVTWFWSGFVGGGGVEGWRGGGAQGWWCGGWAHTVRRHSGLREQLRQRGGEDRQAWGKLGMKRGHEPLRLQGPPR